MSVFALAFEALDIARLVERLDVDETAGALVCFEGRVRNQHGGRAVLRLDYEAHEALAVEVGERLLAEAHQRFAVRAACVHRVGELALGEIAVWVGVAGAHRDESFQACRWIIDEVKRQVPIWKREYYADGEVCWRHP
ncbi:MAG: molybdenum cofactor biosynthesis protein MoaE [Lysobacterales bacterium]